MQEQAAGPSMPDSETTVAFWILGVLHEANNLDDTPAPDDIAGMRLELCVPNQRVRRIGNGCR